MRLLKVKEALVTTTGSDLVARFEARRRIGLAGKGRSRGLEDGRT